MKKILLFLLVILAVALAALGYSFTPATLPAGEPLQISAPTAHPPAGMRISVIQTGKMLSQAGFAYRGGSMTEPRVFGMAAILVQHPKGNLLFDAGFGSRVLEHFKTVSKLMQLTSKLEMGTPAAEQLNAAGYDPKNLLGVILTHGHWDHVSGLQDLPGVPVWVNQAEMDFISTGVHGAELAKSFGALNYKVYDFPGGPYLGFEKSYDVFNDGSVVLVPAPGHTPGSIIAFITLPEGKRYALVGDLVWQREGLEIPAERPWISSNMVDSDAAKVRENIVHVHKLMELIPDLVVVPAHDKRVQDTLPQLQPAH